MRRCSVVILGCLFISSFIGRLAGGADPDTNLESEPQPFADAQPPAQAASKKDKDPDVKHDQQPPAAAAPKGKNPEERFRRAIDECLRLPPRTKLNNEQTVLYHELRELMAPQLTDIFTRLYSQTREERNTARNDLASAKDEIRQDLRWIIEGIPPGFEMPPPTPVANNRPSDDSDRNSDRDKDSDKDLDTRKRDRLYQLNAQDREMQLWKLALKEQQAGLKAEIERLEEADNDGHVDSAKIKREEERLKRIAKILEQGQNGIDRDLSSLRRDERELALGLCLPSGFVIPPDPSPGNYPPAAMGRSGNSVARGANPSPVKSGQKPSDASPGALVGTKVFAGNAAGGKGSAKSTSSGGGVAGSIVAQSRGGAIFGRDPGVVYGRARNVGAYGLGINGPIGTNGVGPRPFGGRSNTSGGEVGGRGAGFPQGGGSSGNPGLNGGVNNSFRPATAGNGGGVNGGSRGSEPNVRGDDKHADKKDDNKHDNRNGR